MSGANTYTGTTTINAGDLTVSGSLHDSTAVTIASGADYNVNASDTVASIEGAKTCYCEQSDVGGRYGRQDVKWCDIWCR